MHKNKIVLPIIAAAALVLVLWLTFHDSSNEPASAPAGATPAMSG